MFLSFVYQSLSSIAGLLSLVTLSNLVLINSAAAFSVNFGSGVTNANFDNSIISNDSIGWETIGDVTTTSSFNGISPTTPSSHLILTNAYGSVVDDVDNSGNPLTFNQSGTDPVNADTSTSPDLQPFLGLSTNALSIDRNPVEAGNPRTSKEGSGIYQDIVIEITSDDVTNGTNGFEISFNWAYLTNDGTSVFGGNQDFAFLALYDVNNDPLNSRTIEVLADSSGMITAPTASNNFVTTETTFYDANNLAVRTVTGLSQGQYTYRVGFGVIDVDGPDRSSALLLDNFNVRAVPFKFSPGFSLILTTGFFGILYLVKSDAAKT
ncbi:MAG: hypothetical protein QNJ60_18705 [Xenococcaceae cyanobacterium MO_188.B19]|nr:hypothetical protein [Xenococcaceae cyanobacterium MO_188.B19]